MNLLIQKEINIIDDLNLIIYKGNKVISLSGGTDSTLLLYLMLKYSDDDLIVLSRIFPYLHKKNLPLVTDIFQRVVALTGRRNAYQLLMYNPTAELNTANLASQFNIDILYTGMTQNPPEHVYNKWKFNTQLPDREIRRDANFEKKNPIYYEQGILAYSPFINYNKQIIKKIYEKENLMDTLFPFTNSCTDDISSELYHCENCWWCNERKWGFGRIN